MQLWSIKEGYSVHTYTFIYVLSIIFLNKQFLEIYFIYLHATNIYT